MRYAFGFRGVLLTSVILAGAAFEHAQLASAQGGIACRYGDAKFRRCCSESYRSHPHMGYRSRADDIRSCTQGRSREDREESRSHRDREESRPRRDREESTSREDREESRPRRNREESTSREDREESRPRRNREESTSREDREESTSRTSEKSAKSKPQPATAEIRRIDCDTEDCKSGCSAAEAAISAFCPAGSLPVAKGEREVQCSDGSNVQQPSVLVCASK